MTKRYVVTTSMAGSDMHVASLLRVYPNVRVLDELDKATALVEMTEKDCKRVSRQHPELTIETNAPYTRK
jgi:hypothetical protein